jgi:hypothetical protein
MIPNLDACLMILRVLCVPNCKRTSCPMIFRDIERSHLSVMLHTLVLPRVVRGQRSDVGSEKHAKNL